MLNARVAFDSEFVSKLDAVVVVGKSQSTLIPEDDDCLFGRLSWRAAFEVSSDNAGSTSGLLGAGEGLDFPILE